MRDDAPVSKSDLVSEDDDAYDCGGCGGGVPVPGAHIGMILAPRSITALAGSGCLAFGLARALDLRRPVVAAVGAWAESDDESPRG